MNKPLKVKGLSQLVEVKLKIQSKQELQEYISRGNRVKYVFFWGHQGNGSTIGKYCLSQWYESPFNEEGKRFLTAEHYLMYQKAVLFSDVDAAEKVLMAGSPGEAKAIGRKVLGFEENIWIEHRFEIVVKANLAKFSQNEDIKEFLINTSQRVLVEASPVDKIWGIGLAQDNAACEDPNRWKGLNLLGFALMKVRDQLAH